jgi:hypothetical protein
LSDKAIFTVIFKSIATDGGTISPAGLELEVVRRRHNEESWYHSDRVLSDTTEQTKSDTGSREKTWFTGFYQGYPINDSGQIVELVIRVDSSVDHLYDLPVDIIGLEQLQSLWIYNCRSLPYSQFSMLSLARAVF